MAITGFQVVIKPDSNGIYQGLTFKPP